MASYNCATLQSHELIECGAWRKGGISAIGILEIDHTITSFTSAAQATAAIVAGDLKIIKNIKGQIPEPSAVENPNPVGCGSETILDSFDRTVTWEDSNVTDDNIDFYNSLNKRTTYLIVYHCEEAEITVIQSEVTFVARRMVPESNKERQKFMVTAKWTAFDESPLFNAPTGIYTT